MSENSQTRATFIVGDSIFGPKCVGTRLFTSPQCRGSRSGDGEINRRSLDVAVNSRRAFPDFEMLDSKIASALKEIISNSHSKRRVSFEEQRAQKHY